MDKLCQQYLEQIERIHGKGYAALSSCEPADSGFMIALYPDPPEAQTQEELETMITNLAKRKPGEVITRGWL